mgnify:FL=1
MPVFRFDGRIKMLAYTYPTENVIRISKGWWIDCEALYRSDIIAHEIAHQAAHNLYGEQKENTGHTVLWAEMMLNLGLDPLTHYEVIK